MKRKGILFVLLLLALGVCLSGCTSVENLQEEMDTGEEAVRIETVSKIAELCIDDKEYNIFCELSPYLNDTSARVRSQVLDEWLTAWEHYSNRGYVSREEKEASQIGKGIQMMLIKLVVDGDQEPEIREKAWELVDRSTYSLIKTDEYNIREFIGIWANHPDDETTYAFMTSAGFFLRPSLPKYVYYMLTDDYRIQCKDNDPKTAEDIDGLVDDGLCGIVYHFLEKERENQSDELYRFILEDLDTDSIGIPLILLCHEAVLYEDVQDDVFAAVKEIMLNRQPVNREDRNLTEEYIARTVGDNPWMQERIAEANDPETLELANILVKYGYGEEDVLTMAFLDAKGADREEIGKLLIRDGNANTDLLLTELKSAEEADRASLCEVLIRSGFNNVGIAPVFDEIVAELQSDFGNVPDYVKEYVYMAAFYYNCRIHGNRPAFDSDWSVPELLETAFLSSKSNWHFLKFLLYDVLDEDAREEVFDHMIENIYTGQYSLEDMQNNILADYIDDQFAAREDDLAAATANPMLFEGADRFHFVEFVPETLFGDYPDLEPNHIALRPDDVRYVIGYTPRIVTVGTYVPTDGSESFEANRMDADVYVIDKLTGKIIKQKTVRGEDPPSSIQTAIHFYYARDTLNWDGIYDCCAAYYQALIE